ncbi:LPS export ABC transporter periplasmic protein LptC [Rhodobacterales bacterium HKCCSP123]|nr:LPS export ABC transporter periplasmic protein LptC [Rhodobacterales bacterium HKCCSP123]
MAAPNRYSTVVTWVKVALPLLALALLSTMFLFSRKPNPDAALPFAEVDIAELVREQRVSQPRFAGTLEDGREVDLVAATAAPQPANPNRIHLTEVEASLTLAAEDRMRLTAGEGAIDLAARNVSLEGQVSAETTSGLSLGTERLIVAMDTMQLAAPGTIEIVGDGISLTAGAMDMSGPEGAAFVSFTGGVRLLYEPGTR